jgi:hypothetical protein
MYYDISISLLKTFGKHFLGKISRKGETLFVDKQGQSNMTISIHKTRTITHEHLQFLGSTLQVL